MNRDPKTISDLGITISNGIFNSEPKSHPKMIYPKKSIINSWMKKTKRAE